MSECIPSSLDIKEFALNHMNSKHSSGSSMSNWIAALIIIVYCFSVGLNINNEMNEKFSVTEEDSKKCLVDFQEKKCNAIKLDENCTKLFDCVQKKATDEGLINKSWSLISISINEVKESVLFPAILILMLFIYQISKSLKGREEFESKND